jgi:predicted site-specific integrase-resolvase
MLAAVARDGRLPYFTTPAGHYRFPASDVHRLLAQHRNAPMAS